jgi:hypothetical protein
LRLGIRAASLSGLILYHRTLEFPCQYCPYLSLASCRAVLPSEVAVSSYG